MARASTVAAGARSFGEEEYIDLDLSSFGEFEFRVRRSSAAAPCADEMLCRGRLHKVAPRSGAKQREADAAVGGGGGRSAATVAPLQQSHAAGLRNAQQVRLHAEGPRRRKAAKTVRAKLQASRAFFRSLFARTSCSDEQCHGIGVRARNRATLGQNKNSGKAPFGQIKNSYGSSRAAPTTLRSSIEQAKLMDEEEHAASIRQRKSFSGVIKWRLMTAPAPSAPAKPPSFSTRRSSPGGAPPLKRSSSARSESEGALIQGAIAYCKRSQQQLVLARKSVSDAALCSFLA